MSEADANLALKALAEFWADMGLEEARVLTVPRGSATQRVNQPPRAFERAPERPAGPRPPPRRLANNPVADARRIAAEAGTLADLRSAIQRFDGCTLKAGAKNTAVCDGVFDAPVMIVGE